MVCPTGRTFGWRTSTIDVTLPFARRKSPNGVDFLAGVGAGRASLGAELALCPETCVHCHSPDGCHVYANSWPVVIATASGPRKFPRAATTTGKSAGAISNRNRNREGRTESWDGYRPPEHRECGAAPVGAEMVQRRRDRSGFFGRLLVTHSDKHTGTKRIVPVFLSGRETLVKDQLPGGQAGIPGSGHRGAKLRPPFICQFQSDLIELFQRQANLPAEGLRTPRSLATC